jgi:D-serine deaminase-like pyridoxal phosphate-dependent protein
VESDISLAVACPVVARYPEDRKIVVYGGAVHLSKDFLLDARGSPSFGGVALPSDEGWTASFPGCYVASLSQEHGVIRASDDLLERVKVGVVVMILPVHSCLTADLLREYVTLSQAVISCGHY